MVEVSGLLYPRGEAFHGPTVPDPVVEAPSFEKASHMSEGLPASARYVEAEALRPALPKLRRSSSGIGLQEE
ncbi:MAG: hypothetical protein QW587_05360 [Candidatus Bathyarchaeia archaeon]